MQPPARRENRFQAHLIHRLRITFPGCEIIRGDANSLQGIPDILMLWRHHWAAFECKTSADAPRQPNQEFYVLKMDAMSFASFVYPENIEDVIHELQQSFASRGPARLSQRQQLSLDQLRQRQTGRGVAQRPSGQTRNGTSRAGTQRNQARRKAS